MSNAVKTQYFQEGVHQDLDTVGPGDDLEP